MQKSFCGFARDGAFGRGLILMNGFSATTAKDNWRIRKYPAVPSRIPLVNSRPLGVVRNGARTILCGSYASPGEGSIFALNLENGQSERIITPGRSAGTYALMEGIDGKIYLDSELKPTCFDLETRTFQSLTDEAANGLVWSGLATRSGHVFFSSSPGEISEYDIANKRFLRRNYRGNNRGLFGKSWLELPDGRALCAFVSSTAEIMVFEPGREGECIPTIKQLAGRQSVHLCGMQRQMIVLQSEDLLVWLDPGTLRVVKSETVPGTPEATALLGDLMFGWAREGHLLLLEEHQWRTWHANVLPPQSGCFGNTPWGDLFFVGEEGDCFSMNLQGLQTHQIFTGAKNAMYLQTLCAGGDDKIYGSTFINQRFFAADRRTEEVADLGRASWNAGQVDFILARRGKIYMACYASADLVEYNPDIPIEDGRNPQVRLSLRKDYGQMRPRGFLAHEDRIWMTTHAQYGKLGGAITWLNPDTGEFKVSVPRATLNLENIILHAPSRTLAIGTSVEGDCKSAAAVERSASLILLDLKTECCRVFTPQDKVTSLTPLMATEDGSVLTWDFVKNKCSWFNLAQEVFSDWFKPPFSCPDSLPVWLTKETCVFTGHDGMLYLFNTKTQLVTKWELGYTVSHVTLVRNDQGLRLAASRNGTELIELTWVGADFN